MNWSREFLRSPCRSFQRRLHRCRRRPVLRRQAARRPAQTARPRATPARMVRIRRDRREPPGPRTVIRQPADLSRAPVRLRASNQSPVALTTARRRYRKVRRHSAAFNYQRRAHRHFDAAFGVLLESLTVKTTILEKSDTLEEVIGYRFRDHNLLTQAMTHRSWAHEQVAPRFTHDARNLHNEALEFLGGSRLVLIVEDYLFKAYPQASEGELSRMKHRLVSAPTLTKASTELGLGEFVRFGRGEEKSGGRGKHALLADIFEAVTGALFLDGGLEAATRFVVRALNEELRDVNPVAAAAADPKTMLQEKLQAARQTAPQYTVVETLGPPHQRRFHVELKWNGGSARGEGNTIKAAEAAAAQLALEQMERKEVD